MLRCGCHIPLHPVLPAYCSDAEVCRQFVSCCAESSENGDDSAMYVCQDLELKCRLVSGCAVVGHAQQDTSRNIRAAALKQESVHAGRVSPFGSFVRNRQTDRELRGRADTRRHFEHYIQVTSAYAGSVTREAPLRIVLKTVRLRLFGPN